jgi:hypothetical protein
MIKTLLYKLHCWAYANETLRDIWRFLMPPELRFSLWNFVKAHPLNKIVIKLIEDGNVSFDKQDEVLSFIKTNKWGLYHPDFIKIWLEKTSGAAPYFNFNGVLLPDITNYSKLMSEFSFLFADTFLFHVFFADNYSKDLVEMLEKDMPEGPYGYTDGDFSAYAAAKGAVCYAFEPTEATFQTLKKTSELNGGKVIPVQKGLGKIEGEVELFIDNGNAGGNTINANRSGEGRRKRTSARLR